MNKKTLGTILNIGGVIIAPAVTALCLLVLPVGEWWSPLVLIVSVGFTFVLCFFIALNWSME